MLSRVSPWLAVLALIGAGTTQIAASAQTTPIETVAGEFLVASRPSLFDVPADAELLARVAPGWALVGVDRQGDALSVAADLTEELGVLVIPNTVLHFAVDPLFGDQWSLENSGQTGGTSDADIDAPEAWGLERGDASVVVAIIDGGIDLDHPDLASQLWVNSGETPGNGLDDDGNGFIDDVNGWDFASGDANPDDTDGHGSHVAGIVAAAENGTGIVGVAPEVKLMAVRACNAGVCPTSTVAAAITYANDNGARVANLSLGAQVPAWLMQPIADAMSGAPDLVFAAAAGNGGTDLIGDDNDVVPFYPASFSHSNLISVAATDHNDDLAGFSNYGAVSVDLGAPGVSVQSSVLGSWDVKSGTSMATPHVAGVAALIRSRFPGASADDTVGAITDGVDPIAELSGKTATGGRLNAAASMVPSLRPNAVATATPNSGDLPLRVTFDGSESTDPGGTIESYEWSFSDGPSAVGAIVERTFMASGTVTASLMVTDNDGNQDSHEVAVNVNAPPVAAPRANPSLGIAPLLVTLDGSNSIDPDGTIESYKWDLENGVHRTGSTVLHDFDDTGVHSVELTVIDDFGSSSSQSMEVLVGFPFTDITASVFGLDIAWLSATGITKGCNPPSNNQFCPNANVTRGQMAAFLARGLGLTDRLNDPFTDDDDSIFEADIEKLAAAGITRGCNPPTNDRFCPDNKVTRGQMAAFLVRAIGYVDGGGGDLFIDDDDSIFEGDIDRLGTAGVTKGCNPPTNNMYCPDGFVTRGQMAAFLHRALG